MTDRLTAAFVPLVDSAVLVAARELGFARAEGLELELVKEPSWASLRDHLNLGYVDCAHALAPLPIAAALGIAQVRAESVVPFVLARGGNAITLSHKLAAEVQDASGGAPLGEPAHAALALAAALRARGAPATFGMTYPFSGHNFELRYWLASAGIHPDRDVRLVAIPPPLMVASLRAGHVDGFCVGEPWNSLAVEQGIGTIAVLKPQLFPGGIEKVLALRPALAGTPAAERLLRALAAAARWCEAAENRHVLARLLAQPEYVNVAPAIIEHALAGRLSLLDGSMPAAGTLLQFQREGANRARPAELLWIYAQMVRWGQIGLSAECQARAAAVLRDDLYCRALGVEAGPPTPPPAAFDGAAPPGEDLVRYLAQFELDTPYAREPSEA